MLKSMIVILATQGLYDVDLRVHLHGDPKLPAAHPDSALPLTRKASSRSLRGQTTNMKLTDEPARQPINKIKVYLDCLLLTALIDTGSSISVLSLVLRTRLSKVLLSPSGLLLKSAFNTIHIALATVAAHLLINSIYYPFEFGVLFESSHDVTLGRVNDELLLSYKPNYDLAFEVFAANKPIICCKQYHYSCMIYLPCEPDDPHFLFPEGDTRP